MMSQQCAKEERGKTPDRRRINKIYFSIVGERKRDKYKTAVSRLGEKVKVHGRPQEGR